MNDKRKTEQKCFFSVIEKKNDERGEEAVTFQLFACHPFSVSATTQFSATDFCSFPSFNTTTATTTTINHDNDCVVCQNDFRSRSSAKLEKELIEQEAKQKELKDKQRVLQENEEQIKRQIQVWKDLLVITCLPLVRHMSDLLYPRHPLHANNNWATG